MTRTAVLDFKDFNENEREPEYLQGEYVRVVDMLNKAKREHRETEAEYQQKKLELEECENQAVALAGTLGSSSDGTPEFTQLRASIAQLTQDIEEISTKIKAAKERIDAMHVGQLEKELSQHYLSVENLIHDNIQQDLDKEELFRKLFELITSDTWENHRAIASNHETMKRNVSRQQTAVQNAFRERNNSRDVKDQMTINAKASAWNYDRGSPIVSLLQQRADLLKEINESKQRISQQITKRKVFCGSMLEDIERVNRMLVELGDDGVDIDAIREKYDL